MMAPGAGNVEFIPARHMKSSLKVSHPGHTVWECGTQSAVHSCALPIMSKTPQLDLHADREPVGTTSVTPPSTPTSHSVALSSEAPGSGVPATARCHS